jgi:hypothetical protein
MIRAARLCALTVITLAVPAPATAHAFAERYDLPLPLGFYLAGAGLAVALSFLGSFLLMRPGRLPALSLDIPVPSRLAALAHGSIRIAALILLGLVIVTGAIGPEAPTRNFATVFIWVIWWVGFSLFTALVADLWSSGFPFRTVVVVVMRLLVLFIG